MFPRKTVYKNCNVLNPSANVLLRVSLIRHSAIGEIYGSLLLGDVFNVFKGTLPHLFPCMSTRKERKLSQENVLFLNVFGGTQFRNN